MTSEKKIEQYALKMSGLKEGFDRAEEEYYQTEKLYIYDLIKDVIKSDVAKEYWKDKLFSNLLKDVK